MIDEALHYLHSHQLEHVNNRW